MATTEEDAAALEPRRLNRNMRLREARVEYDTVVARAGTKLGLVLRGQYPEGTPVAWRLKNSAKYRVRWGIAMKCDDLVGPYLRARENRTSEICILEVSDILRAGDDD